MTLDPLITMSKFASALTLAFILLGTTAHAGVAIVDGVGTSSGRVSNTSSYAVNLPAGIANGSLVVVAIASTTPARPSPEGYPPRAQPGSKGHAHACFECYSV